MPANTFSEAPEVALAQTDSTCPPHPAPGPRPLAPSPQPLCTRGIQGIIRRQAESESLIFQHLGN